MNVAGNSPRWPRAAVCGLDCEVCGLFIGTQEDPARLERLAARFRVTADRLQCDGCRADRRAEYCRGCEFVPCARKNEVNFCGQCPEYPCAALQTFQAAMPHRRELWQNQTRIQEVGLERWLDETRAHYACPQCGTLNSAYDVQCRKCGRDPSCRYVELHRNAIVDHLRTER